jgi:DNA-binding transcriptional LysR family regulator
LLQRVQCFDTPPHQRLAIERRHHTTRTAIQELYAYNRFMRDIEFLTDPGSGEVSVGADMSYIAGGFMAAIIERLSECYPRLAVHVVETTTTAAEPAFHELRNREVDVMLGRLSSSIIDDDLKVETLLDEAILVVANAKSAWAGRRKIALKELEGESWILAPGKNVARSLVEDAFRAEGLMPPRPHVTTY